MLKGTRVQKQGHLVHRSSGTLPKQAARREQAAHPQLPLTGTRRRPEGEFS